MTIPRAHLKDLHRLFASIKSEKEAELLLHDILTPQELASVAERWQLIQELAKGTPQRTIAKKLKISISKITRGSRMLTSGGGGFRLFLGKAGKGRRTKD
ncbi:MAG: Trp family transcriptional regulator [Candidatus Peregrinibacteria bacterium]